MEEYAVDVIIVWGSADGAAQCLEGGEVSRLSARLREAPAAHSFEQAYQLICDTLNAVEDEHTSIPHDSGSWQNDGRMYPPDSDSLRDVPGHAHVKRLRSRAHNTYVAENGAIEIQELSKGEVVFSKPGVDGTGVWHGEHRHEE